MLNNLNSNYNCTWVRFVQKQKQFNYKRQHQFYLIQYSNFMFLCQTWIWLYFNPLCVSVIYLIEWMHCMLYAHCFKRKNLVLLINLPQGHKKWSPQWRSSIQFSLRNSLTIDSNMTPSLIHKEYLSSCPHKRNMTLSNLKGRADAYRDERQQKLIKPPRHFPFWGCF